VNVVRPRFHKLAGAGPVAPDLLHQSRLSTVVMAETVVESQRRKGVGDESREKSLRAMQVRRREKEDRNKRIIDQVGRNAIGTGDPRITYIFYVCSCGPIHIHQRIITHSPRLQGTDGSIRETEKAGMEKIFLECAYRRPFLLAYPPTRPASSWHLQAR